MESRPERPSTYGDEAELVDELRRGVPRALDALHRDYVDGVYRFAYYRLAGREADVEEVVQETFLAALRSLTRFRAESSLSTWLCGIAKHQILALRRRQHRDRLAAALETADPQIHALLARLDQEELPTDVLERAETQDLVGATLSSLPDSYQDVLRRKYFESTPVRDIARAVGSTPKAVESLLTRARVAFRRTFELLAGLTGGHP